MAPLSESSNWVFDMGEVVQLDEARRARARGDGVGFMQRSLSREFLRVFGFEPALHWRSEHLFARAYRDRGLDTGLVWIAARRDVQLRIVRHLAGRTRQGLSDRERVRAILDAAVVSAVYARAHRVFEEVSVWHAFDDGGRIEVVVPASEAAQWRERALRAMRQRSATTMSTHGVTRFIDCAA